MRELAFSISKNARLKHTNEGGDVWGIRGGSVSVTNDDGISVTCYYPLGIWRICPGRMDEERRLFALCRSLADTPGYRWAMV